MRYALLSFFAILACEPGSGINTPTSVTVRPGGQPSGDGSCTNCGGQPSGGQQPSNPSDGYQPPSQPSGGQPSTPPSSRTGPCNIFKVSVAAWTSGSSVTVDFWPKDGPSTRRFKIIGGGTVTSQIGECSATILEGPGSYDPNKSYCLTTSGTHKLKSLPATPQAVGCWHNMEFVIIDP